jgi:hypothetical protein
VCFEILSSFYIKKLSLLFVQITKIHPVYIIILQDESNNKFDYIVVFEGSITNVVCFEILSSFGKKITLLFVQTIKIHPVYIILQGEGYNKFDDIIIFKVVLQLFRCTTYIYIGTIGGIATGLLKSALDTDKRSASRFSHVFQVNILQNSLN